MSELFHLVVEGFSSLRFGCTMALAFLGIAPVLAGRDRAALAAFVFWCSAALSGWARFADLWFAPPQGVLLAAVGLGLAVVVAGVLRWPSPVSGAGAAAYSGFVAGWLWVPCVGTYLSDPLNDAATDPVGTIVPIFAYVFGVSLPLFALAALPTAFPRLIRPRDSRATQITATVLAVVLALSISTGAYSEFVAHFTN